MTLEDSDGRFLKSVSEEDLFTVLEKIGKSLDFCILSNGGDFIQSAGSDGGQLIQYRDASGQYESDDTSLPLEKVKEVFLSYLKGDGLWKSSCSWTMQDGPEESDEAQPGNMSKPDHLSGNLSGDSIKKTLINAAKGEATRSLSYMVRRFIRNIFR
ncbi:MAG: hypothetical protein JEY99_17680 [Spirochaetales bacterium]|nr:hypothetical protein [Spirochaetales bacterium]